MGITQDYVSENLGLVYTGKLTREILAKLADSIELTSSSRYTTLLRAPALLDKLVAEYPGDFVAADAKRVLGMNSQQFSNWRIYLNSHTLLITYETRPIGGFNGGFRGHYSIVEDWEEKLLKVIREYIAKSTKYQRIFNEFLGAEK